MCAIYKYTNICCTCTYTLYIHAHTHVPTRVDTDAKMIYNIIHTCTYTHTYITYVVLCTQTCYVHVLREIAIHV